jgi:hypothetical protein
VVELVTALAAGRDQPGVLEDVEMLRDRLAGRTKPVPGRQPRADLEQRLSVPFRELVEDRPARWVRQGFEGIAQSTEE